ncbi:hypothetical protein [Halovulum sp. GXIMD14793]
MENGTCTDRFRIAVLGLCGLVICCSTILLTIAQLYYTSPDHFWVALIQSIVGGLLLALAYLRLGYLVWQNSDQARRINRIILIMWFIVGAMAILALMKPGADDSALPRVIVFVSAICILALVHVFLHRRLTRNG